MAVATTDYPKIWNREASLYNARKGLKQNLISSVGAIESRVASNSESRQVQWRRLVVGGWGGKRRTRDSSPANHRSPLQEVGAVELLETRLFLTFLRVGVWLQSCLQPGVHLEGMLGVDKPVVLQ